MSLPRYAVVTTTYEPEDEGEVTAFVRGVAEYLSTRADIEILTTRSSVQSWPRNFFEEGHERVGGIHVRRFSCDRSAAALVEYLERFAQRYDYFLFIGPFAHIVSLGLHAVLARSLVVPFEVPTPAELSESDRALLRNVRGFVFPSEADRMRVLAVDGTSDGPAISARVAPPSSIDAHRFRAKHDAFTPFFLAFGSGGSANGMRLIDYFARYRQETGSRRELLIVGATGSDWFRQGSSAQSIGSFSSSEMWDAMAAAEACIMVGEDGGIETCWKAWSLEKMIVADIRLSSIVEECRRSGAGLWYATPGEFIALLEMVDEKGLSDLTSQGSRYVSQYISDRRVARTIASVLRQF